MKKTAKFLGIYLIMVLIFFTSTVIVATIPSKFIKENVESSAKTLMNEGDLLKYPSYRQIMLDNYTDALMIDNSYSIDSNNPIESAMLVRENYISSISKKVSKDVLGEHIQPKEQVEELDNLIKGNPDEAHEYARYWHGYLIYLRPLLLIFDYFQIRIIILIILSLLIIKLLYEMYKRKMIKTIIALAIALICVDIQLVFLSLQSMITFVIALVASNILVKRIEKIKDINLFFFIVGSITCFFDLLTTPLITLGIPLILYLLLTEKEDDSLKNTIIKMIKICIIWGIGYALICISKWVIVDLIYNRGVIYTSIEQFLYRSNKSTYTLYYILGKNISYVNVILLMIITMIYIFFMLNKNITLKFKQSIPYFIVAIMPIAWYIILSQHSGLHCFFTYRLLAVSIFALEIGVLKLFNIAKRGENNETIKVNTSKEI